MKYKIPKILLNVSIIFLIIITSHEVLTSIDYIMSKFIGIVVIPMTIGS